MKRMDTVRILRIIFTIKVSMKETYGPVQKQKKMVWPGTGEHPDRGKRRQGIKDCGREERKDWTICVYQSK
jgi:hypothetical protein